MPSGLNLRWNRVYTVTFTTLYGSTSGRTKGCSFVPRVVTAWSYYYGSTRLNTEKTNVKWFSVGFQCQAGVGLLGSIRQQHISTGREGQSMEHLLFTPPVRGLWGNKETICVHVLACQVSSQTAWNVMKLIREMQACVHGSNELPMMHHNGLDWGHVTGVIRRALNSWNEFSQTNGYGPCYIMVCYFYVNGCHDTCCYTMFDYIMWWMFCSVNLCFGTQIQSCVYFEENLVSNSCVGLWTNRKFIF